MINPPQKCMFSWNPVSYTHLTPNFLFLFMIFLLIVKAFGMTIQISQLESKQRELIQKMALEQKAIEEKETVLEEREAALETCRKGE